MLAFFPAIHWLVRPYLQASAAARGPRPWYALPLRAAGVATLVATVTTISVWAGAQWSGFLATFPIVMSSLIVILQPGIGGKATAAVIGNSLLGLLGFGIASRRPISPPCPLANGGRWGWRLRSTSRGTSDWWLSPGAGDRRASLSNCQRRPHAVG